MDKTFDDYKGYGEDFLTSYFGVNTRRNFSCINPDHTDKKPSMGYDKQQCRAHCFSCGESYDLFDMVGIYFNITDKGEQFKKVQEIYGGGTTYKTGKKVVPKPKPEKKEIVIDTEKIKTYIEECIRNVHMTDYFHKRGLNDETISTCKLGYDIDERAVVIPYSRALTYYQRRYVEEKRFYKPKTEEAGAEPIYNEQALRLKTRVPIFVVESPICALSITQCGGNAVALCGTGYTKLIEMVKKRQPTGTIVLCLDNDDAGKETTTKIVKEFQKFKELKYIVRNIAEDCKDPNELLMKDESVLKKNVDTAIRDARRLTSTEYDSFTAYDLDEMDIEPTEFIVENLIPTGLSMLASPSKYGKSWLMLQLCRCVATGSDFIGYKTNQHDCLYLALEDRKDRLKKRQLRQGKGQRSPKAVHYTIKAPTMDNMKLLTYLAQEMDEHPGIKLIIIDTWQKVRCSTITKENDYSRDYRELGILKEFADDNKIALLLVHHSKKISDVNDAFNNILGSTAIQGALDTMIVLHKTSRNDDTTTMYMTGRDIAQEQTIISLDDDKKGGTNIWSRVGTPEEQQEMREQREYLGNPLVATIIKIIEQFPNGWQGKATELMNKVYDVTGQPYGGSHMSLGKELQSLKTKLYAKSSIEVETKRNNTDRTIILRKKSKYANWLTQKVYEQQQF